MTGSASLDVSELLDFGRKLASRADIVKAVKPVVSKGALNVKAGMRENMAASAHFGQVARSITYDTREGVDWAEAEVGPVTAGRVVGDLAHLAYFGGANNGGGAVRDPQAVLDEEAPRFFKALEDLAGEAP